MLTRIFKEPLLHFLLLGSIIFAAYEVFAPMNAAQTADIVVTAAKIEQLASIFAKTWQRPPSPEELKGLIEDYVREEVYVREALSLGLDRDDTVIRRRLRLKMETMIDTAADALVPSDADLEIYLKTHSAKFEVDPQIAFRQVFLSPARRSDGITRDAIAILESLRRGAPVDPATLGDATLLPDEMPLTSKTAISEMFGLEFAEAICDLEPGQWMGPIESAYGLHIVHVSGRQAGHLPQLAEIRGPLAREWADAKRQELAQARFDNLLKRYRVIVEAPAKDGTQ